MPDNIEQSTIARPADQNVDNQAMANVAGDAYKPQDNTLKAAASDKSTDDKTNQLLGNLTLFDSASDKITQVTSTNENGTTEVLGVGPVTAKTADPFDILHPIDSAKNFFSHPIDSTEQHYKAQAESIKDLYDRFTSKDKDQGDKSSESKGPFDSPEKEHLKTLENKITDPAKKAQFEKDMADFEKRAASANTPLDSKEVANTYKQIGALLDTNSSAINLSDSDRQTVAEQILNHAANPDHIDQGDHNTCAAAALESQMFSKNPAAAAKMIADVAQSGQFVDHDMTCVTPDAATLTKKDAHNTDYPPSDNERTLASQIFQTTAVSMIYREYKQGQAEQNGPHDTGERVGNQDFQGLTGEQVREINRRVTGKDNGDTVIANAKDKTEDRTGGVFVDSPEDLGNQLAQMKKDGKLPAIITVDSRNEPFFSDSKGDLTGGSGGPHDITIKDYVPGNPPSVVIENQWGKQSEHTLSVEQLYNATLPPGDHDTIASLKKQVDAAGGDAGADPRLKLELLRQEHMATNSADKLSDRDYRVQVAQVMVQAEKHWKDQAASGKVDENERRQTWFKFEEMALGEGKGSQLIANDMGFLLQKEKDNDLAKQMTQDQQTYSKAFVRDLTPQQGHATNG